MKKVREGYKMTELGDIPIEWEIKKLGDICDVRKEKFNPIERVNAKYIALEHIEQCTGKVNGVGNSDEATSMKTKFKKGDILFGKLRPYLRKFWVADFDGVCATEILPLYIKHNDNSQFCFYIVQQDKFIEYTNQSSFGTKMPRTSWNDMKEFILPVPTLWEQQQVSLILTSVDEKIENTDKLIEKTKELKKGLMQRLLTKGIGHDKFKDTEIGRIPEEWGVDKIKDLNSFCSNGFVGTASPFYTEDNGGTPYLMSNNVRANKIDERTLVKISKEFKQQYPRSTIYEGDMLTVQSGHIGTSCVVPERYNNTNCHALIITRFNKTEIDPLFISYYINSTLGFSRLSNIFVGTTIKHVNVKDLIQFYVPVPHLKEQKQISLILSAVDEKIDQYESKKEKLQELKKGLMQKLLTGKIRVNV